MIDIIDAEKKYSSDFTLKIGGLHIDKGSRVALVGANGSGKSTLLKLIAGVIRPDSGKVINNAAKTGYSPQSPYAFGRSVEKNITLAADKDADINEILEVCELTALKNKTPDRLSGGEKQRMFLARMLAGNYPLLLLDEPLSAVDIETGIRLGELIKSYCEKNGTTLLISTHVPSQALGICSEVIIMNRGEIAEYSSADALKTPSTEFGRLFTQQWRL